MFTFQSNASDDENKLKFFVDLLEKLISISYCQVKNARASRLFRKGKLDKKKTDRTYEMFEYRKSSSRHCIWRQRNVYS